MTGEEELTHLREEKKILQAQLAQREEHIQHLEAVVEQQNTVLKQLQDQLSGLSQQVKTLQERLAKDSHNSHLPPSSDRFVRAPKSLRPKSEQKSGGQPGHPGSSLQWSTTPDEIVEQHVERCEACQHELHEVAVSHVERRQVLDVPAPRLLVRQYRAEQKQCPVCQHLTAATFPDAVTAPLQYGSSIGAIAVYLVQQQLLPLARACEVMAEVLGVPMSEGTVGNLITRCAAQLGEVEQQIKEALKEAEIIHQDETSLRVEGKRYWEHVTCTPTLTHYHVDVSRGQPALQAIGILPQFAGISIHDGWGSYFLYGCEHAACIVHLLRDLVALEEQGVAWATDLKVLLLSMKDATDQARALGKSRLDFWEVVDWEAQFLHLLDQGDQLHPRAPTPAGQRGRGKQSAARNLLDRLRKQQKAVLTLPLGSARGF